MLRVVTAVRVALCVASAWACQPEVCDLISCTEVEESACEGVYSANGGLCGCCPRCEPYKVAGEYCGRLSLGRMQPQCAPGLVCRESDQTCRPAGTSRHGPVTDLRAGEYCGPLISVSLRSCEPGLECVSNFCKPPPRGPGANCADMLFEPKCVEGHRCVDSLCVAITPDTLGSQGQSCSSTYPCAEGLSCRDGICKVRLLRENERCGTTVGSVTPRCAPGLQCLQSVCARPDAFTPVQLKGTLGIGRFCGIFSSLSCGPGLQCVANVCRFALQGMDLGSGQSGCLFGRRCRQGLICDLNVCQQPRSTVIGLGEYCDLDSPGRVCAVGTECIDRVCVANDNTIPAVQPGTEGHYCVPDGTPTCNHGFSCVDNRCRIDPLVPEQRPENCVQHQMMVAETAPNQEQLETPHCNPDGTWSPVQCDRFTCFCVDSTGTRLDAYFSGRAELNSAKEYMNCKCARDEAEYSKRGLNNDRWLYQCDRIGNYAALQCMHSSCFCSDHDGNPLTGTSTFPPAPSHQANPDCGCARDKFNFEMYGVQRFPSLSENIFVCESRGRYRMRCDIATTGFVPLVNQVYVMCCCVDARGAVRSQFGRRLCFRSVDINNGNWCQ